MGNIGQNHQIEQVLWPASVLSGIIMCKIVYEATGLISSQYFKGYAKLRNAQKVEWNNRGFSTFHAIIVAVLSFHLVVQSDLFKDDSQGEMMVNRKSTLSDSVFGMSLGYFLSDLGMILWYFPALGGKEYLIHHGLSMYSIFLSLVSGKGQIYILMVLFTESTTPFVNLRWYLDLAGQKNSKFYTFNGIALFFGWLVARILLFIYFYMHIYTHFDQVRTVFPLGFYSLLVVPPMLAMMNVVWFWKICKGLKKTLMKARHRK
ncbi:hypothetical protein QJS10_CPA03g00012 [Acorus calamus]|uniref:TLC domain-containing protein n=1 Tax=Acorus calamus TaxID=4465 RepID=A0AAV9F946_ACOCL|nr:hypothetical protein QJS10_CPA03g00012 [Acorus calamus]